MSSNSGEGVAPPSSDVNIISDVQLVPPSHLDAGAAVDASAGDDGPLNLSLPAAMEEAPAAAPAPVAPEGLGVGPEPVTAPVSIFEAECLWSKLL